MKSKDPPAAPVLADTSLLSRNPGMRAHANYLFVLLFLLYMFDYIDRTIVTSLFPFLKTDLGLNDTQSGSLVSAVYWAIVAFTFPISILIDRWSRKRSIGLMVTLWSIATGVAAFIKTFPQLFIARAAVGVGEAGYAPGGNALISAVYPQEKRSRMLGLWNASIPLGIALGTALGGIIATRWGWKHAFGLVALPGLLIGILFFFTARDYKTVELVTSVNGGGAKKKMRGGDILRAFLRTPSLLLTYIGFAGNTFVSTALITWLPSFFNRTQGIPMNQAGLKTSLVLGLAIVGAPVGGVLADAWMKRRVNARLLFGGITSLASAALLFVAFALLQGAAQYAVLLLAGFLAVAYVSAASAVTEDVVHPGLWAISYSICVIVQNLLGSSLAPVYVGALSDRFGLAPAMLSVPAFSAAGGILFLIGAVFYARDLAKVEKVPVEVEK
jgi:MFS family permease